MEYRMTFDYHTHTEFSHGKGTIRENVMAARRKGLKKIAIADHGPGHSEHGLDRRDIPEMRRIINELNREFDDIEILLSIEANIKDRDNNLDISREETSLFDFIIAGYHMGIEDAWCIENYYQFFKGVRSREQILRNTNMLVKAVYENDIRLITHPGDRLHLDVHEVAKACADTDTWIEISTQHPNPTDSQLRDFAKEDVKFVISSDAHFPEKVGNFMPALNKAFEAGIDASRIVNIERLI